MSNAGPEWDTARRFLRQSPYHAYDDPTIWEGVLGHYIIVNMYTCIIIRLLKPVNY